MHPGDLKRSPDESFFQETLIFIDEGFLNKVSKHIGQGKYIKFDKILFVKNLAKKQSLKDKQIFYYTCQPFQSPAPSKEEEIRKEGYDKFIRKMNLRGVVIREGRCQRLKLDGDFVYKQKAVDVLLAMDLASIPLKFKNVKKIILISSDSDFVPIIKYLKEQGIKTILYTYYETKRDTDFSRSNELIKSVHKYILLTKQDFVDAQLK